MPLPAASALPAVYVPGQREGDRRETPPRVHSGQGTPAVACGTPGGTSEHSADTSRAACLERGSPDKPTSLAKQSSIDPSQREGGTFSMAV